MTKRIIALVLTLMMALSLCGTAMAETTENEAKTAATDLLTALGIVKGVPDGSLELSRNVTRAEAAALMARVRLGAEEADKLGTASSSFKDVNTDFWASEEIDYCAKNKIIAGDGMGNYFPNNNVTMNELMAISLRTLGYGEFVGANWESEVKAAAEKLPTLSTVKLSSEPAGRGEVINVLYQALFTPISASDAEVTMAAQKGVSVVKLSGDTATFAIDGVKLDGVYPVTPGEAFPAAAVQAVTYVPKEDGDICVLLNANERESTATLIFANGHTESVKTESDYSEISGSVGKFVAWNSETKKISPLKGISGIQDLNPSVTALGGISVDKNVQFVIHTKDEDYERFTAFSGIDRMPTIYEAEYVLYTATDGKQYVYIANGQNSTGYYCRGQIFIVNPKDYDNYAGETRDSNYYATEGARNGEVGTIKFTESFGKKFYAEPDKVMPGLYLGVEYKGMRVVSVANGQPRNPLLNGIDCFSGLAEIGAPLKGILQENGVFYIGTNEKFRAAFGNISSVSFKAEDTNLKAFYFDIDASGNIKSSIRRISDVADDNNAYVWGTVNNRGEIMNLYIVHSNYDKWNRQWDEIYGI